MAYKYTLVAEGVPSNIRDVIAAEEKRIPEGGLAELQLIFNHKFSDFDRKAQDLHVRLRQANVRPWPGEWRMVFVDPDKPIYYIRWQKGFPWAWVIVAAIIAIIAVILAWTAWKFFHVVAEAIAAHPWIIPVLFVGGLAVLLIWVRPQLKEGETGAKRPGKTAGGTKTGP